MTFIDYYPKYFTSIGMPDDIELDQGEQRIINGEVYYGRPSAGYGTKTFTYTGKVMHPKPWTPQLDTMRKFISKVTGHTYDFCLIAESRDGHVPVFPHSDTIHEGEYSIASVSFGDPRIFQVMDDDTEAVLNWILSDGDMIIMSPPSQENTTHMVPVTEGLGLRYNLTFRTVL